jgi:murein DD-endopeptidase MepM/ murein hydrolase activator NlpD
MLEDILIRNRSRFSNILPVTISCETTFHLDLSIANRDLSESDITDNDIFNNYLDRTRLIEKLKIPVGGYNERRILYSKSNHFGSGEAVRNIHLGIDFWIDSGTPVFSLLDSKVHSFANNTNYRDYGPTIILEHELEGLSFYSLYGHLSIESLDNLHIGKELSTGEIFATIGDSHVNGLWPPHLHFQLITEMGERSGDFPGVCSQEERLYFLNLCPNPDIIFNLGLP